MNYYPHHIGDFNSATRHLTRMERSVYRDLIDLYYDTETPLTLDFKALCRLIIARSDEEITAVEQVLNEFFSRSERGWSHARCDEEIEKYQANIAAKSAAGKASAARRSQKEAKKPNASASPVDMSSNGETTAVEQVLNECATNQEPEPRTNNQEEKTKQKSPAAARPASLSVSDLVAHGVDAQVADEFLAIRKRKRAPLTALALNGIKRQADDVGWTLDQTLRKCIERGWQGFEAGWVRNEKPGTGATRHGNFAKQDYHAGVGADGSF